MNFKKVEKKLKLNGINKYTIIVDNSKQIKVEKEGLLKTSKANTSTMSTNIKAFNENGRSETFSFHGSNEKDIIKDIPNIKKVLEIKTEQSKEKLVEAGQYNYDIKEATKKVEINWTVIDEKINDLMSKINTFDSRIIKENTKISICEVVNISRMINSSGLDLTKSTNNYAYIVINAFVKYEDGRKLPLSYSSIINSLEDISIEDIKKVITEKINILEKEKSLQTDMYKIVISKNLLKTLLSKFSSHFTARSIIDKTSTFFDKLGQRIFSDKINITDTNYIQEMGVNIPYDDEAMPTTTKSIVKKGVFDNFISDQQTASIMKTKSSGNSFGGRTDYMFLKIENGESDFNSEIKKIKKGIYIDDFAGVHSGIQIASGDFSLQLMASPIIEGEIKGSLKGAILNGNIYRDIFNNIESLCCDLDLKKLVLSPTAILEKEMKVSFTTNNISK